MWHALKDFANGHFYEPRFYGQAYNTMLESLIAVPLFIAGIEANFALPIITSLLAIFPFVLISFFFYKKIKQARSINFIHPTYIANKLHTHFYDA